MRAALCVLVVVTTILATTAVPARAQSCDDDTIDQVSEDGAIITMLSGATFRIRDADRADTALWQTMDEVLICRDETEIINKDENNEHVSAHRIH